MHIHLPRLAVAAICLACLASGTALADRPVSETRDANPDAEVSIETGSALRQAGGSIAPSNSSRIRRARTGISRPMSFSTPMA